MLSLTRRLKQRILIGEDIVVEVLQINGKQIRLGIEAPRDVKVIREELVLPLAPSAADAATDA